MHSVVGILLDTLLYTRLQPHSRTYDRAILDTYRYQT